MPASRETALLTIAAIRTVKGETQYLFSEKEAIFKFPATAKGLEESAELLKNARRRKLPVKAQIDTRTGTIHRVTAAPPEELEQFKRVRVPLEKPEKTSSIKVSDLDPTVFNLEKAHPGLRCFRACRNIIPNYKKAKEIFDFCAQQTCSLGGPFSVNPCIPFQYVRDGCYARAHKMRWIITTKYRYCCDKVFSFAIDNGDTLAVQANKWGGCCVFWWYHVAPLVRLRLGRFGVLLLVIDPGMFDKPVLLTSWLSAQENKTCSPNAHVSMYSIQPGSAYTPSGGPNAFTTDPNYTQTDATLTAYRNLVTC
jgi:glutaminase-like protein